MDFLTYNDAWFVNESLAFYFSNTTDSDNQTVSEESGENSSRNEHSKSAKTETNLKRGCCKFCDNLILSIKGKLFVLDLNIKRKLQSLSKLAQGFIQCIGSLSSKHSNLAKQRSKTSQGIGGQEDEEQAWSSLNGNVHFFDRLRSTQDSNFWQNFDAPNSRKTLGVQQEKILQRLEQVVQAKRNQQHQSNTIDHQLFNMTRAELNAGLKRIRTETSRRDLLHQSSTCSSSDSFILGPNGGAKSRGLKSRKAKWISSAWQARGQSKINASYASDQSSNNLCAICYTNAPNIFTLPCQHQEICSDCFIEIIYMAVKHAKYPLKCVICRQKIEKIRCSRKLLLSVIEKNRIIP